jgi:predicted nucleotidyltransferase
MDWNTPATAVMSHGTAAVLRVLAGADGPFTIREVARLADISVNRAHQAISRLAEHGIATVDARPGAHHVRLNRDHLATEPSIALANLRSRALNRLRDEFASWPRSAAQVSMYGSAARGDGNTHSDIDLLVIHSPLPSLGEQEAWDVQLATSAEKIHRWTGNWASWFQVTDGELRRMAAQHDPLVAEWQRDAITLIGPPLSTFFRRTS